MLIGYARVSTRNQNLDLQRDALKKAGCRRIFTDTASRSKAERPGLADALSHAREGDTLIVWQLDRLSRSLKELIATVTELEQRGVGFRSVQEAMDTTTAGGKLIFHVFGSLAEFERAVIRERTRAGLHAARIRGHQGGRPRKLKGKQLALAASLMNDAKNNPGDLARTFGVSRTTLYRYWKEARGSNATGTDTP